MVRSLLEESNSRPTSWNRRPAIGYFHDDVAAIGRERELDRRLASTMHEAHCRPGLAMTCPMRPPIPQPLKVAVRVDTPAPRVSGAQLVHHGARHHSQLHRLDRQGSPPRAQLREVERADHLPHASGSLLDRRRSSRVLSGNVSCSCSEPDSAVPRASRGSVDRLKHSPSSARGRPAPAPAPPAFFASVMSTAAPVMPTMPPTARSARN